MARALPLHYSHSKLTLTNEKQLVELKNGETFNGHMILCDNFMNLTLKEVYQTAADGLKFWKMAEAYIRGNHVRFSLHVFCRLCVC